MNQQRATTPIEIRAIQLCKSFGEHAVLKAINLSVRAGELVCIVGASGSGKTVLLDHLIGLMPPTSGSVEAADHNAPPDAMGAPVLKDLATITEDELDLIRLHWAVVFQRNALFSGSVRENIALWLREHTTLDVGSIDARVRESLASVALNVGDVIDKDRDALSGGMAKRVAVARAIACDPILLFYDEPTTGLDPMIGATIHDLIFKTHNQQLGKGFAFKDLDGATPAGRSAGRRTSIIVTHDRDLLRRIRPRIVMIHEGAICFDGTFEAFTTSDLPPAQAYLAQMPVLHARETHWE